MYLFFDTETNGLPKNWKAPVRDFSNWPRLVQIAWALYDDLGNEIERNDHIITPNGFTIPKKASKIHGITTKMAKEQGIPLMDALIEFLSKIEKSTTLVAHNMAFDEKIMGAEFLRNSMKNLIPIKYKICTMRSTTEYMAIPGYYGYKWPKLSELYFELFGVNFENAHNAAADIDATAKCFWKAKELGIL